MTKWVLNIVSLIVVVGVFEYRVIFMSFGSYIGISYPWNVILVTTAIFLFSFNAFLIYIGNLK